MKRRIFRVAFVLCGIAIFASCAEIRVPKTEGEAPPSLTQPTQTSPPIQPQIAEKKQKNSDEGLIAPIGLYAPIPNCAAKITTTTGLYADGVREWKEFAIQVCDLPFDTTRVALGILLQSQRLGHGSLWANSMSSKDWHVIEYYVPQTPDDFEKLNAEGPAGLRRTLRVLEKGVPKLIARLPDDIQEEILAFIAYSTGALEILPYDQDKQTAQKILHAVREGLCLFFIFFPPSRASPRELA